CSMPGLGRTLRSETMNTKRFIGIAAVVATATAAIAIACSNTEAPDSKAGTFYGPSQSFAQGTARAWVQTDAAGDPTALGIAMTEQALNGLPATATGPSPTALMVTLPLPAQAQGHGFDHAELGWNPNGHEPPPQYGAKAGNYPSANMIPTGYVPPPGVAANNAVPQMGLHWTDTRAPELNGQ